MGNLQQDYLDDINNFLEFEIQEQEEEVQDFLRKRLTEDRRPLGDDDLYAPIDNPIYF